MALRGAETVQYLVFQLAGETYGIPSQRVTEIVAALAPTGSPESSATAIHLLNLRGRSIRTLDLRRRYGYEPCGAANITCILLAGERGADPTGLLVDHVVDVLTLEASDVVPAPAMGNPRKRRDLVGLGRRGGRELRILALESVLAECTAAAPAMVV